jgi:hypothetical protein
MMWFVAVTDKPLYTREEAHGNLATANQNNTIMASTPLADTKKMARLTLYSMMPTKCRRRFSETRTTILLLPCLPSFS